MLCDGGEINLIGKKYSKKWLTVLFSVMLVSLIVTGCGGQNAGGGGGQSQSQIAYFATNSEPLLDWDPSVEFSNGIIVLNNVYETLLKYDAVNNKIIPELATDYKKSEDGLVWTFKLKEGVKFHDGTDMNAESVKYSIERTIQMKKGASFIWNCVQEINVLDPYTVEFKLKYPAPLDLITSCGYAAFIFSPTAAKSNQKDWFSKGNEAGTGPYMLQSYTRGDEVILTKFDDYWKGWEGKHFDKVVIKKVSETSSRRQMIEKGEADVTIELPYEDIESLRDNKNVNILEEPSYTNLVGFFNTEKKPLDNKLVRQALSYAFPYEDVVKYGMGGYAEQAKGPIPKGHWGHGDNLFQYKHDLEKAKELLAQAGYPDGGFKLLFTYMSGDESEKKAAELYKSELAKLNIELEVRGMPWDSQWEMAKSKNPEDRQDMMVMYWWPDYPSPYSWLYNLYHSEEEVLFNLSYWENEEFDKIIDTADQMSGIDRDEAERLYIKAQETLIEEAPSFYPYDKQCVWVMSNSFKGHTGNPIYPNVVFFYNTYRE